MHRDHTDLLERISKFEIDRGDEQLRFADRLASENGWTREFAQRVIHEYKRFVFMAMTAGHPVTPSKAVDQAWHLHLTYTRSYWDELCSKVLRLPLHHDPSRGGPTEDRKFEQWYGNTLASYKRVFGDPPRDIWPRAQVGTLAPQEANAWSHTVKQHRTASRRLFRIAATVAILAAAAMAAFACTNQAKGNQTSGTTAAWIVVGVVASVIVFIIAMIGSATRHDTRQHQQHHGRAPA